MFAIIIIFVIIIMILFIYILVVPSLHNLLVDYYVFSLEFIIFFL